MAIKLQCDKHIGGIFSIETATRLTSLNTKSGIQALISSAIAFRTGMEREFSTTCLFLYRFKMNELEVSGEEYELIWGRGSFLLS